jgi:adenosylcobinamide-GDP ribazoletransferase
MTAPEVARDAEPAPPAGWLGDQLRVLLTGVMFLTRLPCPAWVGHDAEYLARSTVWFPAIGALVGGFGALAFAVAALGLPPLVAAALSTVATVWLTGAFHEDALADSCDGFGGGWGKDQILAIMKDSRVGSYGVVGLALVLVAKLGALAALAAQFGPVTAAGSVEYTATGAPNAGRVAAALVAAHVLGRWSSLPLIWRLEYVRETGSKSKPFAASVTPARLVVGSALAVAVVVAVLGREAVPVLAVALAVTLLAGRYFRRVLGGITGDCLGAANQAVELCVYLALAWHWPAWDALGPHLRGWPGGYP